MAPAGWAYNAPQNRLSGEYFLSISYAKCLVSFAAVCRTHLLYCKIFSGYTKYKMLVKSSKLEGSRESAYLRQVNWSY